MTKSPFAVPLRPDYSPRSGHSVSAPLTRPSDAIFRALAVGLKYQYGDQRRSVLEEIKASYGEDDVTRLVMSRLVTKAAVIPADTTTSGWADTLVQTSIDDLIQTLTPLSVYPKLAALGDSFTFGRNGAVTLPARNTAATLSSSFILQGGAIPVRQGAFTPLTFTSKKMGVITVVTREILQHSTPSIEAILRTAIVEDTAVAIDTILLDTNAATTTRPAGLRNVAKVTASVTASIVGFIADIKALATALITGAKGNLRAPVWIATATGDTPEFTISDQAVLHMEDTSPAAITTSPGVFASPVRSMFQTDCFAIKMLLDISWGMRRTGVFQWTDTMAWN